MGEFDLLTLTYFSVLLIIPFILLAYLIITAENKQHYHRASNLTKLIMLAGIYYGAQYGGSTTSILVNVPGEASSVVTCLDGHQMARQGRAGAALTIAALGSFVAGCFATLVLALLAVPLSEIAFKFGPAEYFSLMVFGLIGSVVLASSSLIKAVGMIVLGLLLGMIGTDVTSGAHRFTFGILELSDGIGFVSLAMGLFGICDIINSLEKREKREILKTKLTGLWLKMADLKASAPAVVRGTLLGSLLGILPGGGAIISSFAAYMIEKKSSRHPESFGKGNICGVAGPESANNAASQTSFVPLLTLGIPPNVVLAMMAGAMMIHGIQPGPRVITSNPALFWGVIVSMWLGNVILVLLNLPLVGIWVQLLRVPYSILAPVVILFTMIGSYSIANQAFDLYSLIAFGVLGYALRKLKFEAGPLPLAFILGPMIEGAMRQSLLMSGGSFAIFFTRPISMTIVALFALFVMGQIIVSVRRSSRCTRVQKTA